jgi:hypothetical protein
VPEKLTGTLTLNIKKFIHNIIPYIIVCKLYSVAILRHLQQPLLIENYIHFVAVTADFKTVSVRGQVGEKKRRSLGSDLTAKKYIERVKVQVRSVCK